DDAVVLVHEWNLPEHAVVHELEQRFSAGAGRRRHRSRIDGASFLLQKRGHRRIERLSQKYPAAHVAVGDRADQHALGIRDKGYTLALLVDLIDRFTER